jgi:hypothetical protein
VTAVGTEDSRPTTGESHHPAVVLSDAIPTALATPRVVAVKYAPSVTPVGGG